MLQNLTTKLPFLFTLLTLPSSISSLLLANNISEANIGAWFKGNKTKKEEKGIAERIKVAIRTREVSQEDGCEKGYSKRKRVAEC